MKKHYTPKRQSWMKKKTGNIKVALKISKNEQSEEDAKKIQQKMNKVKKILKKDLIEKTVEKIEDEDHDKCFIDNEDEKFHIVEKKIGEGATSVAYKIIDKRTNRVMRKKVLKIDTNKTSFEDAQNALKEFDALRILKHPFVDQLELIFKRKLMITTN